MDNDGGHQGASGRTLWWERIIGLIAGAIFGLIFGVFSALFLVLIGYSYWLLLICPPVGVMLSMILGVLFPKAIINLLDTTSVFGKPLLAWFTG